LASELIADQSLCARPWLARNINYSAAASESWSVLPRQILLRETAIDGQPALTLAIEGFPVVHAPASPVTRLKLVAFANIMLWAMRRQIEVAPGVYIGQSSSVEIPAFQEKSN